MRACKICNYFQYHKSIFDIEIGKCVYDKKPTMSDCHCENICDLNYLKYLMFYFQLVLKGTEKKEIIKLLKDKNCQFVDLIVANKLPLKKDYLKLIERKKFLEKK
jgi:hypothetical protein